MFRHRDEYALGYVGESRIQGWFKEQHRAKVLRSLEQLYGLYPPEIFSIHLPRLLPLTPILSIEA